MKAYFKSEAVVGKVTRALAGFCLMVVFALFLMNILTRASFISWNPTWIDEIIQFFLVYMIFLSAAELVRTGDHFMVDILVDRMHGKASGRYCRLISTVIMLITYAVILYFGIKLCIKTNVKATFTLPSVVKMSWFYACIPLSALFMVIYAVRDVIYAVQDILTGGEITRRQDLEKQAALSEDEDAKAIAEAAAALEKESKKDTQERI
ncbi:MAG: TRAP transporter small permease [Succinatimonas sp.]|nr:TRAP transporter small permease [Succinatimonas sp.]